MSDQRPALLSARPSIVLFFFSLCLVIFLFAWLYPTARPLTLKVTMQEQTLRTQSQARFELMLTDNKMLPVDQARVSMTAHTTEGPETNVTGEVSNPGAGLYQGLLIFTRDGAWEITIHVQADGFAPLIQILRLDVTD